MKRILIVTGQSGSGKSSALQVLEDLGYYCIDNLPLALLPEIVAKLDSENNLEQLNQLSEAHFWEKYHNYLFKKNIVSTFEDSNGNRFVGKIIKQNDNFNFNVRYYF